MARTSAGHCALIVSATISAMKPELPAPVRITRWAVVAEPVAQEAIDRPARGRQQGHQRIPERWLLDDLGGGVRSAEALPVGRIGERDGVHSRFLWAGKRSGLSFEMSIIES